MALCKIVWRARIRAIRPAKGGPALNVLDSHLEVVGVNDTSVLQHDQNSVQLLGRRRPTTPCAVQTGVLTACQKEDGLP